MSSQAVTVFFSYSHKDKALRDELANHLEALKFSEIITDWHDGEILPGDEWDREIQSKLDSAQIILLLVSSDFIGSRYCREVEIKRAMARHEAGEARVIPIILRTCFWKVMPFGKLQALPKDGTPVMDARTWPTWDDAFYSITEGIHRAAGNFSTNDAENSSHTVSPQSAQIAPFEETVDAKERSSSTAIPAVEDMLVKARKLLGQEPSQNAQAQYRARVKEYLVDRDLTVFHEARLEYLREQLKLTEAEAQRILSEELAPIEREREQYRETLSQVIETGQDPTEVRMQQELAKIKQSLQLTEREIEEIEQPILEAYLQTKGEHARKAYKNMLERLVHAGEDPTSHLHREELKRLRQDLGLSEQDTVAIEQFLSVPEIEGSENGINYIRLRNLLKTECWKAADQETYEVMIRAVGRNPGEHFRENELLNFPCNDLRIIDRLWTKYSEGKFGISVQKRIYVECGARLNVEYPSGKFWNTFGEKVGWVNANKWISYDQLDFSVDAPKGHLPAVFGWKRGWGDRCICLFSRIESC